MQLLSRKRGVLTRIVREKVSIMSRCSIPFWHRRSARTKPIHLHPPFTVNCRAAFPLPSRMPFRFTVDPPWQFHFHLWFGGLNTSLIESSSPQLKGGTTPKLPFRSCGLARLSSKRQRTQSEKERKERKENGVFVVRSSSSLER